VIASDTELLRFAQVAGRAERLGISNKNAALSIGVQRVRDAKGTRGLFP
jgi:glutamate dehydrogenase (NAD(P)+)